jgi:hypothetical protein
MALELDPERWKQLHDVCGHPGRRFCSASSHSCIKFDSQIIDHIECSIEHRENCFFGSFFGPEIDFEFSNCRINR